MVVVVSNVRNFDSRTEFVTTRHYLVPAPLSSDNATSKTEPYQGSHGVLVPNAAPGNWGLDLDVPGRLAPAPTSNAPLAAGMIPHTGMADASCQFTAGGLDLLS